MSSSATVLTVRFRGVRGSIPSAQWETLRYGGNTSCIEVRCSEKLLILDAGTGIRSLGDELLRMAGTHPIHADLLISHTHWDHIQGLPFFAPAYSRRNRIRIIGAEGRGAMLERALKNQMDPMHFPVGLESMHGITGVEELSAGQTRLGNFYISTIALNHPGGCAGFRLEANGTAIGYLPDHEPYRSDERAAANTRDPRQKALLDFVRDLDLLILDTQYTEPEYQDHIGWGHGCLPDSVALAVEAGVRRLALFHHDASHADSEIDRMVKAGQALADGSSLLVQGAAENETITFEPKIHPIVGSIDLAEASTKRSVVIPTRRIVRQAMPHQ